MLYFNLDVSAFSTVVFNEFLVLLPVSHDVRIDSKLRPHTWPQNTTQGVRMFHVSDMLHCQGPGTLCMLGRNVQFSCTCCTIHSWLDIFLEACEHYIHTCRIIGAGHCSLFQSCVSLSFWTSLRSHSSRQLCWLPLLVSSPDITCIPSLVASNIRPMSTAVDLQRKVFVFF